MLTELLSQVKTVAIGGHVRPDGDCAGSCLGLYQYIKEQETQIKADLYLEEMADSFGFMASADEILHTVTDEKEYDLFIALDCGDAGRLGFAEPLFRKAKKTLCIDHHISNGAFADENIIDPDASSTSEMVFRELPKDKISKYTAECLYLGIVHDTGVFQYSCTAPETMEAAAELMRKGIDASEIIQSTFYEKTYAQNQILGRALLESILFLDGRCIAASVSRQEMEFFGVTPKDLEGIVSQLRITKGVEVAVFMYETGTHEYKVSLRSGNKINVSRIAQYFGGGGHVKAAGFTTAGSMHDVLTNLARQIEGQFETE